MSKYTYQSIDPDAEIKAFIEQRAVAAAFDAFLAEKDAAQVVLLAADPASPIDATARAAADDNAAAKQADAAALDAKTDKDFDPEAEIADRKVTWATERRTQLEGEHLRLAWLRDNPEFDPEDVDRAEQVRQVEAALAVL